MRSAKDENQDGFDGSYLECFVKENPHCSGQAARDHVMLMISKAWEELNKDYDDKQKLPLLEEYINVLLLGKV
ncbi:hypothetical protein OPV22_028578 [Ensete ventricosum]|uniref:HMG box domain-containing protein n=1 Tax=Ensete ventricosum TaxID=4639 RepID=A0AAV8Q904_ENSVE|nr:hypothetical protein OPV22_028578 [Ensete ventricosum]